MKMKSFLVMLTLVASSFLASAQKTAHIDLDSLLGLMPEMTEAKKASQDYYKQLETTLTTMQTDLSAKYKEYTENEAKYTDLIKQTKQNELNDLNQRIQDFQVKAQQDFQKKNDELTRPINEKAKKAIEQVAKEKGYKYVIDSGLGVVLYSEPADDIMPPVKTKLGIK